MQAPEVIQLSQRLFIEETVCEMFAVMMTMSWCVFHLKTGFLSSLAGPPQQTALASTICLWETTHAPGSSKRDRKAFRWIWSMCGTHSSSMHSFWMPSAPIHGCRFLTMMYSKANAIRLLSPFGMRSTKQQVGHSGIMHVTGVLKSSFGMGYQVRT